MAVIAITIAYFTEKDDDSTEVSMMVRFGASWEGKVHTRSNRRYWKCAGVPSAGWVAGRCACKGQLPSCRLRWPEKAANGARRWPPGSCKVKVEEDRNQIVDYGYWGEETWTQGEESLCFSSRADLKRSSQDYLAWNCDCFHCAPSSFGWGFNLYFLF